MGTRNCQIHGGVRLTHFNDRLYGHYMKHARSFGEPARTMDEDLQLSYKEYTYLKP